MQCAVSGCAGEADVPTIHTQDDRAQTDGFSS